MVPKAGLEPARRELRLILSLFSHVSSNPQYTETLKVRGFQASCISLYFSVCNYSRMSKRCQITAAIFPSLSPALVQCKKISPEALKLPLDNIVHHAAAVHLRAVEMHERLKAPLLIADRGVSLARSTVGAVT